MYRDGPKPVVSANVVLLLHLFFFLCDIITWTIQAILGVQPWFIFGGWSIYLTLWGQLTQSIYFGLALACDFGIRSNKPWAAWLVLQRDRFFTFEFALANLISIVFWGLIFPVVASWLVKDTTAFVLCWFQHGLTGFAMYVECFIQNHRYMQWWKECLILYGYAVAYLIWTLICYQFNHHWPYPFQQGLSAFGFVVVHFGMLLFATMLYFWGRFITRWFFQSHVDSMGRSVPKVLPFMTPDNESEDSIPCPDVFLAAVPHYGYGAV